MTVAIDKKLEHYRELKQLAETYNEECARFNDCSICPLSYGPSQMPSCRFMEVISEIKEIEKEVRA